MTPAQKIDLRSDTVTLPDAAMKQAMVEAPLGDDVFGDDPTVKLLEKNAAELVEKDSTVFMPSGTMGNLAAVLAHTSRGDAVILDAESHIFYYEAGGSSVVGGVQFWPVADLHCSGGSKKVLQAVRPLDQHFAPARLLCLENSHNRQGGTVLRPDELQSYYQAAQETRLHVHLDGARIFNASTALNCHVTEFTRCCDSVMFCLSKGLGAPIGSILAGPAPFIESARRYRKLLGGGMRQAGILAAAGLAALQNIPLLKEDHRRALALAQGLANLNHLKVDPFPPPTNIILLSLKEAKTDTEDLLQHLESHGIQAIPFGKDLIRMVIHKDINDRDINYVLNTVSAYLKTFS